MSTSTMVHTWGEVWTLRTMCSAIERRTALRRTSSSRSPAGAGARRGAGGGAGGGGAARALGAGVGGARALDLDLRDLGADGDRHALGDGDLEQGALEGGGDLGVHLVGDDLDQRLVLLDEVALLFQPAIDGALGDRLTQLGHLDR